MRCDRSLRSLGAMAGLWALAVFASAAASAGADEVSYRFSAPIIVERGAPFVQLPLPASAYGRTEHADLRDLRIVDVAGERVPFALLPPRAARVESTEQRDDVRLYPLPARPPAGQAWPAPLEVVVQEGRISVRQAAGQPAPAPKNPSGWLFDLGDPAERKSDAPAPQTLRLRWSGPAEFGAAYQLETSADLRQWRAAGSGQVLALASPGGALTQPDVALPADGGRFVRLAWAEPGAAPALTGAAAVTLRHAAKPIDGPDELVVSASPEPAPADTTSAQGASAEVARRALHFDLGGALPLQRIDLRFGAAAGPAATSAALAPDGAGGGTALIAPVRVQARTRVTDAWRDVGGHVFYRFDRGAGSIASPAFDVQTTARYVRIVPDARAAALDPQHTRLVVQAALASVVFAAQGRTPFTLLAGAADAPAGALPIATLVPMLDAERARFGRAALGAWRESEDVVRKLQSQQRLAALRPWLLWAVLLAGVAGLGFMVWRLSRQGSVPATAQRE